MYLNVYPFAKSRGAPTYTEYQKILCSLYFREIPEQMNSEIQVHITGGRNNQSHPPCAENVNNYFISYFQNLIRLF